jgi:hypothetical protein
VYVASNEVLHTGLLYTSAHRDVVFVTLFALVSFILRATFLISLPVAATNQFPWKAPRGFRIRRSQSFSPGGKTPLQRKWRGESEKDTTAVYRNRNEGSGNLPCLGSRTSGTGNYAADGANLTLE